jgi:hypothetical protein
VDRIVTINPIVAPVGSHPGDPWAGIWLAEDVEAIHQGVASGSHSQTWRNVASTLRSDVATFGQGAATGVSGWQGTAATAYQTWASHQQTVLGGLASAARSRP